MSISSDFLFRVHHWVQIECLYIYFNQSVEKDSIDEVTRRVYLEQLRKVIHRIYWNTPQQQSNIQISIKCFSQLLST